MNCRPHDFDNLEERLLRLEKQNLRFKQFGTVVLVVATSMLIMGEASPKRVIEANEFVLKDSGNKVRARLAIQEPLDFPQLDLFDENGRPSVALSGGIVPKGGASGVKGGGITLYDSHARERGTLQVDDSQAYLRLSDAQGALKTAVSEQIVVIEDGAVLARSQGKNLAAMVGGEIKVSDEQGFSSTLGTVDLITPQTGESHKTSAAALVMFDRDKNVIWKAP